MLVRRWQAEAAPTHEIIRSAFENDDLQSEMETLEPGDYQTDHRHPFEEVRQIMEGQLLLNISGNKLLLRPGDRIEIPANTRHSVKCDGGARCISLIAYRA